MVEVNDSYFDLLKLGLRVTYRQIMSLPLVKHTTPFASAHS